MKTMKAEKAIKLITDWAKYSAPYNKQFHTSWLENGFEVCTDNYRALRLYMPISNDLEDKTKEPIVKKFYREINESDYVKVDLPSVEIIKAEIKENIGRSYKSKKLYYRLGDDSNLAVVNAKYLLDLMEILGTNEIYYNADRPKDAPLLLESEIGDALLLPIYSINDKVGFFM